MTDDLDQRIEDAALSFSGLHDVTLDSKGRIAVPFQYRKLLKERNDMFSYRIYLQRSNYKERPSIAVLDPYALSGLVRVDFSALVRQEIDVQGRIVVPKLFSQYAKLGRDVSFIASQDGTHLHMIPKEVESVEKTE